MNPKIPKAVEILIQLIAVLVIASLGKNSYELVPYMLLETKGVGFIITTNTYHFFWHVLIYGLYIVSWFVAYYGIFARFQSNIRKKLLSLLLGWLLISIIHIVIVVIIGVILQSRPTTPTITINFSIFGSINDSIFSFYFILFFSAFLAQTAVQFLYRYQELEEADHMQSELALIRSQLRPHFFFNTLNNLYSMALETNNETLANGIQNLTAMMRHSLKHSTKELVPLSEEWEYIENYVELQKLRVNQDSVKITLDAKGRLHSAHVAPMILINFVENAFKHGISYEKPSHIEINLEVIEDAILLNVRNSNHPSKQDTGISGIGTTQTKKLLHLYYEDDFDLNTHSTKEEFIIHLKLPKR